MWELCSDQQENRNFLHFCCKRGKKCFQKLCQSPEGGKISIKTVGLASRQPKIPYFRHPHCWLSNFEKLAELWGDTKFWSRPRGKGSLRVYELKKHSRKPTVRKNPIFLSSDLEKNRFFSIRYYRFIKKSINIPGLRTRDECSRAGRNLTIENWRAWATSAT